MRSGCASFLPLLLDDRPTAVLLDLRIVYRQTAFAIVVITEMPSTEYIAINIQIFMFINVLI